MYQIMTGFICFLEKKSVTKQNVLFQIDLYGDVAGLYGAMRSKSSMDLTWKKAEKNL